MKKLMALCLMAVLSLQVAACGVDKNAWMEEGKEKIGATLDCGQFVVDGEVRSFPSSISDWTIGKRYHIEPV